MKKNISLFLTKAIYFLFLICTIIALFIVYKNIKGKFAIGFVVGYAIFAILFILYIAVVAILNARKVILLLFYKLFQLSNSLIIFRVFN